MKRDAGCSSKAVLIALMLSLSLAFISSASGLRALDFTLQSIRRVAMQPGRRCLLWPTDVTTIAKPIHAEEIGYSCSAPLTSADFSN